MHPHPTTPAERVKYLRAAVIIAAFIFPAELLAQTSNFVAPGRVEGGSSTLSIATAASGTVSKLFVHEGIHIRADSS
jgi:hypothetical protein